MILAIETSCDDTCAAVVGIDGSILSSVVSSQAVHDLYGGVVPEIAARHHLELIGPAIDLALEQAGVTLDSIERVAVTQGPGLTGALLVGIGVAKGIAMARSLPLCGVDHLHGHIVPRWSGDNNFMPVIGQTRILPQALDETWQKLAAEAARLAAAGEEKSE